MPATIIAQHICFSILTNLQKHFIQKAIYSAFRASEANTSMSKHIGLGDMEKYITTLIMGQCTQ